MTKFLKMKDLSITILCVISSVAAIITLLLAKTYQLLYVANFLRMFADVTTIGIRSALSKIVGEKDVGKVSKLKISRLKELDSLTHRFQGNEEFWP